MTHVLAPPWLLFRRLDETRVIGEVLAARAGGGIAPGFVEAPNPRESGKMGAARKYPDELRDRAVRLVLDLVKDQDASVTAACRKVGGELGIKADTLRGWAKQAQVDRGMRPGSTSADAARMRALERENAELRRVNAILRTASAFFAAELGHR